MQLDTLLIFLFSASILTLSPGPDIIYVFLKSSTDGKIAGIKTVLGLTTGLFFHTILSTLLFIQSAFSFLRV